MDKQLKERVYKVAKETVEGGCSPIQLKESFAKDYISYMTKSGLVSENTLVNSIGFKLYTKTVIDLVEYFEFEENFIKLSKDLDSFKLEVLCQFMGCKLAYNYYYTEVKPMPQAFINAMIGSLN